MASSPSLSSFTLPPLRVSAMLIVAFLGIVFFVVSLWGEHRFKAGPDGEEALVEYVLNQGVEIGSPASGEGAVVWQPLETAIPLVSGTGFRTDDDNELGILIGNSDLIRLFPGTEVIFEEVNLSSIPMVFRVHLKSGSLWVSSLQGVATIEVTTGRLRTIPEEASAMITHVQSDTRIFAAHHPVRVAFLGDDESRSVWDDYLLTESHEVNINESQLNPILAQVQYTKLVKEYPFIYIPASSWDVFVSSALDADLERLDALKTGFLSSLRREGNEGSPEGSLIFRIEKGIHQLRRWFTFDDAYLIEREENDDLDLLYEGLYLIAQRRPEEGQNRLNFFEKEAGDFKNSSKLIPLNHVFHSILWGDEFYPAKTLLRSFRLASVAESDRFAMTFLFLRERLNEVYDLLDRGELANAQSALLDYNRAWFDFISVERATLAASAQELIEERQILQNLLYREDAFYSIAYYEVLSALEKNILSFTSEESDLNEERQSFIQDKIRVLNHLLTLMDEKKVGLEDGSELAYLLIAEAQDMLQKITVKTAVIDYFVSQLSELSLKFQFVNSSDYFLAEGTFDQKFETYLQKEDDLAELTDYIRSLKQQGAVQSTITLDEAVAEAESNFDMNGIYYVALMPLGDIEYRLFTIQGGRVNTVDIKGNYDRVTGIVYDLKIEGESFSTGVKLENLKVAVEDFVKAGESVQEEESVSSGDVSSSSPSSVEVLALSLAEESLVNEGGLTLVEEVMTVEDLNENLFHVQALVSVQGEKILVDFSYDQDEKLIFDAVADPEGRAVAVSDSILADFEQAVLEAWRGF